MKHALSAIAAVTVLTSGCAGEDECGQPSLEVSGEPTTISSGDDVTVMVKTTNFELRDPGEHTDMGAGDPSDDTSFRHGDASCGGHYHIYLDDFMTNPLSMAWEETQDVTIEGDVGDHEILVRLNADDHKILDPDITDSFPITIE